MKIKEQIERLNNNDDYYGEFGNQYLSNSMLYSLLNNPSSLYESETTLPLISGGYFHTQMLEPDKLADYPIIDASSRNTKIYKEALLDLPQDMCLLLKEAEALDELCSLMKSNLSLHGLIYHPDNTFEDPMIKEIHGMMWKGKRDIGHPEFTIDIKTTSDITKFSRSAYLYNYDSQAWLYREFWGKPVIFIVICKKTKQMGLYDCSDEFYERGEQKVIDGIIQYNKFYGPDKYEDVNNFYFEKTL